MTTIRSFEMFPVEEAGPRVPAPPPEGREAELIGLSPGARRTLRRKWAIEDGVHPLTGLPLHPCAPGDASAHDRYLREFTCGTCVHKIMRDVGHKTVAKCDKVITYSEWSDLRNWFPACIAYREPRK